jgi:hypothetical protein
LTAEVLWHVTEFARDMHGIKQVRGAFRNIFFLLGWQ